MKATKKTSVKKTTDKKVIVPVVKENNKPVIQETEKKIYTYKNISNITLTDGKKIVAFLKKEDKRLIDRMNERKIKSVDVKRITKYIQHQFLAGKNTFISVKYIFVLNDNTKKLIHFGKRIK